MDRVNKETVRYLSELSRIQCSEDDLSSLMEDLQKIIGYMELLQELDTEGIPPCDHVLEGMINVMRKDQIGKTIPREVFLSNAPSHTGGLIRVPPIFK